MAAPTDRYVWPRWDMISGYKWTLSGSGSAEYYITTTGDAAIPNMTDPPMVEGDAIDFGEGTLGSLTASQFKWGDNDALGFDTLYVRLADDTDPDSKASGFVRAGGDDTGTSFATEATAAETTDYAITQVTAGADGDTFHIKAGAADVLGASLDVTTDYSGTPSETVPVTFHGYSAALRDGGIGEIEGGGTYGIIDDAAVDYLHFIDLKLGDCGSQNVILVDNFCKFIRCEFHTSSASALVETDSSSYFGGCHFHSSSYSGIFGSMLYLSSTTCVVEDCLFDCGTIEMDYGVIRASDSHCTIRNNVILANEAGAVGVYLSRSGVITGNSIVNLAAGTSAGIYIYGANNLTTRIERNIASGFSAAGGKGIWLSSATQSVLAVRNNLTYNCTTGLVEDNDSILLEGGNGTASADPFIDAANLDFRVTAEAREFAAFAFPGAPGSVSYLDAGAVQRVEPPAFRAGRAC